MRDSIYYDRDDGASDAGPQREPAGPAALAKVAPKPFSFTKQRHRIDWRVLHGVDVDRIVRTNDVAPLQAILDLVAFGDIEAEDPLYVSEINFLRIFRLAQLCIEHLLYSQEELLYQNAALDSDRRRLGKQCAALDARLHEVKALLAKAKNDLRRMKKQLATYEVLALMGRDALRAAPAPAAPPPRDLRGDLAQAQVTLSQVTADRDALAREMDKLRMELQRVRDEAARRREEDERRRREDQARMDRMVSLLEERDRALQEAARELAAREEARRAAEARADRLRQNLRREEARKAGDEDVAGALARAEERGRAEGAAEAAALRRAKAEAEAEADAAKREVARLQRMVEALRSEAAEGGKGVSQAAFDQLRSERDDLARRCQDLYAKLREEMARPTTTIREREVIRSETRHTDISHTSVRESREKVPSKIRPAPDSPSTSPPRRPLSPASQPASPGRRAEGGAAPGDLRSSASATASATLRPEGPGEGPAVDGGRPPLPPPLPPVRADEGRRAGAGGDAVGRQSAPVERSPSPPGPHAEPSLRTVAGTTGADVASGAEAATAEDSLEKHLGRGPSEPRVLYATLTSLSLHSDDDEPAGEVPWEGAGSAAHREALATAEEAAVFLRAKEAWLERLEGSGQRVPASEVAAGRAAVLDRLERDVGPMRATTKQLQRHREAMLERGRALVARCDALLAKGVEAARAEGQLRQAQTSLRDAEMRSALGVLQDVGEGEDAVRVAEVAAEIRQRGASVPPMTLAEINAWRAAFPHQVQGAPRGVVAAQPHTHAEVRAFATALLVPSMVSQRDAALAGLGVAPSATAVSDAALVAASRQLEANRDAVARALGPARAAQFDVLRRGMLRHLAALPDRPLPTSSPGAPQVASPRRPSRPEASGPSADPEAVPAVRAGDFGPYPEASSVLSTDSEVTEGSTRHTRGPAGPSPLATAASAGQDEAGWANPLAAAVAGAATQAPVSAGQATAPQPTAPQGDAGPGLPRLSQLPPPRPTSSSQEGLFTAMPGARRAEGLAGRPASSAEATAGTGRAAITTRHSADMSRSSAERTPAVGASSDVLFPPDRSHHAEPLPRSPRAPSSLRGSPASPRRGSDHGIGSHPGGRRRSDGAGSRLRVSTGPTSMPHSTTESPRGSVAGGGDAPEIVMETASTNAISLPPDPMAPSSLVARAVAPSPDNDDNSLHAPAHAAPAHSATEPTAGAPRSPAASSVSSEASLPLPSMPSLPSMAAAPHREGSQSGRDPVPPPVAGGVFPSDDEDSLSNPSFEEPVFTSHTPSGTRVVPSVKLAPMAPPVARAGEAARRMAIGSARASLHAESDPPGSRAASLPETGAGAGGGVPAPRPGVAAVGSRAGSRTSGGDSRRPSAHEPQAVSGPAPVVLGSAPGSRRASGESHGAALGQGLRQVNSGNELRDVGDAVVAPGGTRAIDTPRGTDGGTAGGVGKAAGAGTGGGAGVARAGTRPSSEYSDDDDWGAPETVPVSGTAGAMARGGSHGSHAEERPMAVQEQSIAFDDSDGSQF